MRGSPIVRYRKRAEIDPCSFLGVNDEHIFAFVETVHGADLHAIGKLTSYAVFGDDVWHRLPLRSLTHSFHSYTNEYRFGPEELGWGGE
jgi:hypothetical protein